MELEVLYEPESASKLVKWKIKPGSFVNTTSVLCHCESEFDKKIVKIKCHRVGTVLQLKMTEGQTVNHGDVLVTLEGCSHPTVMKDMCAECGADLREECGQPGERKSTSSASVAMVHSIPELIVSHKEAQRLGHEDEKRLISSRKLVLLVDLDQTLLHTTNDTIPSNLKDAYHFQLLHRNSNIWYHTKFRPGTLKFLETISEMYELHICTFGVRMYAHKIASFLDPDGKLFSHRILSRDECFNATSKTANLKALFPCGDRMVCIIDDREDVWGFAPNLIHVRPYIFFDGTADINAPQGFDHETWEGAEEDKKNGEKRPKKKRRQVELVRVPRKKTVQPSNLGAAGVQTDLEVNDKTSSKGTDCTNSTTAAAYVEDEVARSVAGVNEELQTKAGEEKTGAVGNSDKTAGDEDVEPDIEHYCDDGSDTCVNVDTSEKEATPSGDEVVGVDESPPVANEDTSSGGSEDKPTGADEDKILYASEQSPAQNVTEDSADMKTQTSNGDGAKHPSEDSTSKKDESCVATETVTPLETPEIQEEYEEMVEWEDTDDYLIYLEDILRRIHKAYFKFYDETVQNAPEGEDLKPPEIKTIVPYVKKKVLQGANIVFSGVFPNNKPPEKSQAYIVAKSLGANILTKFGPDDESTGAATHLVAALDQTEKVYEAKKRKKLHVVNPEWLWTCAYRWEWVDERLFPLTDEVMDSGSNRDSPVYKAKKRPKPDDKKVTGIKSGGNDGKDEGEGDSADIEKRRFSDSYNPFYAFSKDDLANMDKEVGDLLGDDEDEDSDTDEAKMEDEIRRRVLGFGKSDIEESNLETEASSDEGSMSADFPKGWDSRKRKRSVNGDQEDGDKDQEDDEETCDPDKERKMFKLEDDEVDSDGDGDFSDSIGSVDEEIAAAVERELLNF